MICEFRKFLENQKKNIVTLWEKNIHGICLTPNPAHNFRYPSSAAAVVSGGHLSARAAFLLDRNSPAVRPCV
jgi:hypothetical protein